MSKFTPTALLALLTVITSTQFASSAQAATEVVTSQSNIFVLGGEALPNSPEILQGDKNVVAKEQQFLASLGIDSADAYERPRTSTSSGGKYVYTDSDIM